MDVKALKFNFLLIFIIGLFSTPMMAQDDAAAARTAKLSKEYNETVMHHIGNANEFHIVGDLHMPLPCILYAPNKGLDMFMSSKFEHGSKVVEGYVLDHGVVKRIIGGETLNDVHLDAIGHETHNEGGHDAHEGHGHDGKGEGEEEHAEDGGHDAHYVEHVEVEGTEKGFVYVDGKKYELERSSTLLSINSWFDLSISKNVFSMLLATLVLFLIFGAVGRGYKKRVGQAPKGIQSLMEPLILFIRDEVAIPAIGEKWEKYFPFLLSIFFFVLINNLFGIIPIFPFSSNVTGNVGTTLALAFFTFLVTNFSGNKHYWGHVFWMPGVPGFVKPILTVIELAGLFIKPFTLFIRLFANITAGHIIILSLIGLIWMFGDYGQSITGSGIGAVVSFLFVAFINLLELFVSFLQAFIFALLSALYIGAAVEEHHHEGHEDAAHAH